MYKKSIPITITFLFIGYHSTPITELVGTYRIRAIYKPDRTINSREALDKRTGEILAENPDLIFSIDGPPIVMQNLGILRWSLVTEVKDLVQGVNVILVEAGGIKARSTGATKVPTARSLACEGCRVFVET
ncbi:hypothetical protein B0O99DRAFT_598516 [Bisporella sp. PMI_857]|nr:hypothetical protein B0O99DRAFT_598516 [Bisporella sp. PMI_857]